MTFSIGLSIFLLVVIGMNIGASLFTSNWYALAAWTVAIISETKYIGKLLGGQQ